jgi:hypothetical protein
MADYVGRGLTAEELFLEIDRILMPSGVYIPFDSGRKKLVRPFREAGYKQLEMAWQQKP